MSGLRPIGPDFGLVATGRGDCTGGSVGLARQYVSARNCLRMATNRLLGQDVAITTASSGSEPCSRTSTSTSPPTSRELLPAHRGGAAGRRLRRPRRVLRAAPLRLPGRPALPVRGEPALQALGAGHRRARLLRRLGARGRPPAAVLLPARGLLAPAARAAGRRLAGRIRHHRRARAWRGPQAGLGAALAGASRSSASGSPSSRTGDSPRSTRRRLLAHLHYARAVKTPYELACMRRASALAARGHVAAREAFRAGASEFEVHLAYCAAAESRDDDLPYGNIIAFDEGAAVLHYQHLDRRRDAPRRSFLIDAGAQFRGYASDITRTWSGGDAEFSALVAAMDALQQRPVRGHPRRPRLPRRAPRGAPRDRRAAARGGHRRAATPTPPWPSASRACSSRTASATCSACRCTTSPGSRRTRPARARSRGRTATRSCG